MNRICTYLVYLLLVPPISAANANEGRTNPAMEIAEINQFYLDGLPHLRTLLNQQFPGIDGPIYNSFGSPTEDFDFKRTGNIQTLPFIANTSIDLLVTGHPLHSCGVKLIAEDSGKTYQLEFRTEPSPEKWAHFKWKIPSEIEGKEVKLVVEDFLENEGVGWVAVCFPSSEIPPTGSWTKCKEGLGFLLTIAFQFLMLMLPGVAVVCVLDRKGPFSSAFKLPTILVATGIFGHLAVYLYLFAAELGKLFSLLLITASTLALLKLRSRLMSLLKDSTQILPLVIILVTATFIWSAGMITHSTESSFELSKYRFNGPATTDSYIPFMFAERLYFEEPLRPFDNDWLTSDRPPLQTGLLLLQMPFLVNPLAQYHVLGVMLQCFVFAGIFQFTQQLFGDRRLSILVVFLSLLCGLTVQNAFYVWPKLLSAGFVFLAYALVFLRNEETGSRFTRWILLGFSVALALLSHGGSIFGLVALPFCMLFRRKCRKINHMLLATASFTVCYAPWILYQKLVDPPGDRLLKWHLAGTPDVDDRSGLRTILDAYSELTLQDWWHAKIENVKIMAMEWQHYFDLLDPDWAAGGFKWFKLNTFIGFVFSLGILNLVWLGVIPFFIKKFKFSGQIRELFWIIISGLVFWVLAIYSPGRTLLWHGSYFLSYASIILCTTVFYRISKYLAFGALALNSVIFILVWNIPFLTNHTSDTIFSETNHSIPMIMVNIFMWITLISLLKKTVREEHEGSVVGQD
ncbi:MAG: hypothetical protein MI748_17485 [Opitutales bacterium]|nr:hypothetical protein [Opitutales bacterium]